jgi:putative ABC transport system permease protein
VTAAATLGLGIGVSAAIFSVVDAILLRPLPYPDPDRLVLALRDMPQRDVRDFPFSNADFFDLRDGMKASLADGAAIDVTPGRAVLQKEDGTPEQVSYASVTTNFLHLLGAGIALGRDFQDADGQPQPAQLPNAAEGGVSQVNTKRRLPAIAILSYEYWQRRYGGNPAILGHEVAGTGARIVGVASRGFELLLPARLNIERAPDIWFAARLGYDTARRLNAHLRIIGRLKSGVSFQQAKATADVVAGDLRKQFATKANSGDSIRLEPMRHYLVAEIQPALAALMGAAVFLLLIACANVANLCLVRASLREREFAVRTALGGGFWRLASQSVAETVLLAGLGVVLGVGLAWLGIRELLVVAPGSLPRVNGVGIDGRVLVAAALSGMAAAALCGLIPFLRSLQPAIMQVLRAAGRPAGVAAGGWLRNCVVVVEVALTFVLLIGSGLMFRSFQALERVNPGYDAHGLLTFQILGDRGRSSTLHAALMRDVEDHLRSLPWVRGVAGARALPLNGVFYATRWSGERELASASRVQASADLQIVLPGYFEAFRVPLLAGRTFTDGDNQPERNSVIIDETLAAKAFPLESAVGKRLQIILRKPDPEWVEVVGVVAHQRNSSLAEQGREQLYLTSGYLSYELTTQWAIRTAGDPAAFTAVLRSEMAKIDPHLVVTQVQPMDALVGRARAQTRFSLLLIAALATNAAVLAIIGIYGVLSTVVRQRTAEIGVRMALGAPPATIFQLVVGRGMWLSVLGTGMGLMAALVLTRLMTSMLVGVQPADPATFATVAALFLLIAAAACWLPARRAARLDPVVALREE